MSRFLSFLCISMLVAAAPAYAGTAAATSAAKPAGSFTAEQLLPALTRDLSAHFNLEGDLQLDLLRPWTPPARLASEWTINVVEYPAVASSSMLVRCQLVADATPFAELNILVRGSLWRDVWT